LLMHGDGTILSYGFEISKFLFCSLDLFRLR
jgi:hypothetical protein